MIGLIKKIAILLLIVSVTTSCYSSKFVANDSSEFTNTIDSLATIIKTVSQAELNFKNLSSPNYWEWYNSNELVKVNRDFYENYLKIDKELGFWGEYQTFFIQFFINLNDEYVHLILLQRVHNDDIGNMYLLSFDDNGNILNKTLLSKIEKSPDDLLIISSQLKQTELKTVKIYLSAEEDVVVKDSIVKSFNIERFDKITLTQQDSVRVIK